MKRVKDIDQKLREAYEAGRLEGENNILKMILEQKLEIKLIPRMGFA